MVLFASSGNSVRISVKATAPTAFSASGPVKSGPGFRVVRDHHLVPVEHDVVIGDAGLYLGHPMPSIWQAVGRDQNLRVRQTSAARCASAPAHAVLRADHQIGRGQGRPSAPFADADRAQLGLAASSAGDSARSPAQRIGLQPVIAGLTRSPRPGSSTGRSPCWSDQGACRKADHQRGVFAAELRGGDSGAAILQRHGERRQAAAAVEHVQHAIALIGLQPLRRRPVGLPGIGGVPCRQSGGIVIARQVEHVVVGQIAVMDAAGIAGVEVGDQVARAGDEGIVAGAAGLGIGTSTAVDTVLPAPPVKAVGAGAAQQDIVAVAAIDRVGTVAARKGCRNPRRQRCCHSAPPSMVSLPTPP